MEHFVREQMEQGDITSQLRMVVNVTTEALPLLALVQQMSMRSCAQAIAAMTVMRRRAKEAEPDRIG